MNHFLAIMADALTTSLCVVAIDLVLGYMNRYYFAFVAQMLCGAFSAFLFVRGQLALGAGYAVAILAIGAAAAYGLTRLDSESFAIFSLAQVLLAYYITISLDGTGNIYGLDLHLALSSSMRYVLSIGAATLFLGGLAYLRLLNVAVAAKALGDSARLARCLAPLHTKCVAVVILTLSVVAAAAGILISFCASRLDASFFSADESFWMLMLLIVGGRCSLKGALAAPALAVVVRLGLETLINKPAIVNILIAAVVIAFLIKRPTGIWGEALYDRE